MAETTNISWTQSTMNPWRGCVKVSPACTYCYADRQSRRNPAVLGIWGAKGTRVLASEAKWVEPLKWNRQMAGGERTNGLVFCASLADVFEDWDGQMQDSQGRKLWADYAGFVRPESKRITPTLKQLRDPYTINDARLRLWDLIRKTPLLTWQLLTKRPENIHRMLPEGDWPNVWLGTSVENEEYLWRADVLQDAPQRTPVRFLSCEPLLGAIPNLHTVLRGGRNEINWIIVGGESGGQARSMHIEWVSDIVRQCREAKCAVFVKQLGRSPTNSYRESSPPDHLSGRRFSLTMRHDASHGSDIRDFPNHLRVREFPEPLEIING